MSLATRIRALVSGAWPLTGPLPWLGERIEVGGASLRTPTITPTGALALTAVYRACSLLSDAVSLAPPCVMVDAAHSDGRVLNTSGPGALALKTLTHADAEMFAFSTALCGNGYLKVFRDKDHLPTKLQAIPSWRVTLEIDTARNLFYRIAADSTLGEPEELLPEFDVVHAKYRVIGANRYVGVPPAASCSPSFALALQSRDVLRYLFANLASPGGVLSAPGKIDPVLGNR